jgi:hypothetical protein
VLFFSFCSFVEISIQIIVTIIYWLPLCFNFVCFLLGSRRMQVDPDWVCYILTTCISRRLKYPIYRIQGTKELGFSRGKNAMYPIDRM